MSLKTKLNYLTSILAVFILISMSSVFFITPKTQALGIFNKACDSVANPDESALCANKGNNTNNIPATIGVVIGILAFIIGAAAVIVIIVAGFMYLSAGGNSSQVAKARSAIIYSLVGVIVAVMAGVISRYFVSVVT